MRILDSMFNHTVSGLTKALDLSWRRNKVLTSNIANAETPQYRAVDLQFGRELEEAFHTKNAQQLARTQSSHLDLTRNSSAKIIEDLAGATKADGNNVDIDIQMAQLAKTSGEFATAAQLIKRQIGLVRTAIRESRQ